MRTLLLFLFFGLLTNSASSNPQYNLQDLIDIAKRENPILDVLKAKEDAARSSVVTAESYLNPEIEVGTGPSRFRTPNTSTNQRRNYGVNISQPLEFPNVRGAKKAVAESRVNYASSVTEATMINLSLQIKKAFYDVLQNEAVLKIAEGDRDALKNIREKVALRVEVGEAPRYELIKADTELVAAQRDADAALLRISESKFYLRGLVSKSLTDSFGLVGSLPPSDINLNADFLRNEISKSPKLKQIKASADIAENRLRLEEKLINPGLTLNAGVDQDPDITSYRFGISIPIPIWNRRQGQIGEAAAGYRELQAQYTDQELALKRDIESAFQRYLIAQQQVKTFESGLLDQAESVLKVAESAYRYGERGILEYLDAQRTFRLVRKDYLASKYDYVVAILEIEQLLGMDILENKI
ncbi:TolC family protein [Candidatus Methylopumilus universalis]|uniref:TolC family protein n=1 Tax=Candidatus Methylopumilus universalis TaxID=2588536 RepID=UPI00111D691E|nr:TolC family protein [Candidatus Methylopumilus universalis]QDC79501.1 TolC family protein [Candidatus Methylopumilus universalis]QDC80787.1 TolC family protein [Candidatus Methylopumilus universalis]QDC82096.1 TolC family protein [Candidatus Methylopumilus universalis]QDC88530.1 TolC family protein [Candidatus Methylopumilus universalis]